MLSNYGLLSWFLTLAGRLAAFNRLGGRSVTSIAQFFDFQQALVEGFDKHSRARLRVLPEACHAEDDVVWSWVVAGAVAVGHHWAVAAEHFQRCRNLEFKNKNKTNPQKKKKTVQVKLNLRVQQNNA